MNNDDLSRLLATAFASGIVLSLIAALLRLPPWPWSILPGIGLAAGLVIRHYIYGTPRNAREK